MKKISPLILGLSGLLIGGGIVASLLIAEAYDWPGIRANTAISSPYGSIMASFEAILVDTGASTDGKVKDTYRLLGEQLEAFQRDIRGASCTVGNPLISIDVSGNLGCLGIYTWHPKIPTACSVTLCGQTGQQTQDFECRDVNGSVVADTLCPTPRPATVTITGCTPASCGCKPDATCAGTPPTACGTQSFGTDSCGGQCVLSAPACTGPSYVCMNIWTRKNYRTSPTQVSYINMTLGQQTLRESIYHAGVPRTSANCRHSYSLITCQADGTESSVPDPTCNGLGCNVSPGITNDCV